MSLVRWSACRLVLGTLLILAAIAALYAALRFLPDRPVTYADPVEHFKYGSLGGERNMGFPYWLFAVLPEVCPDLLPGKGYASLGVHLRARPRSAGRHVQTSADGHRPRVP